MADEIPKTLSDLSPIPLPSSPSPESQSAIGSETVPVMTPEGELADVAAHELKNALDNGYRLAQPEDIQAFNLQKKYGGAGQQAIAGAEALGKGVAGPLATGFETRVLGVPEEDILGREEANPVTHVASEIAGIAAPGSLLGKGLGAVGEGAEALTRLATAKDLTIAPSAIAKIGSGAVKAAIENATFQAQDEVSKMILKDPEQTAGSAMAHIGLAGALGGGVGGMLGIGGTSLSAANQLWEAKAGPRVQQFLGALTDRLNGESAMPADLEKAALDSGITVPESIRAAYKGGQGAKDFNILREGKNNEVIGAIDELHEKAANAAIDSLGKSADEIANYSEAKQGRAAMDAFKEEHAANYEPIAKEYEEIGDKFKETELPKRQSEEVQTPETVKNPYLTPQYTTVTTPGAIDEIADKVAGMAEAKGYNAPDMPQSALVRLVQDRLMKAKTIQDLSNIMSTVRELSSGFANSHLWNVASELNHVLMDSQQEILSRTIGKEAPELFGRYQAARAAYKGMMRVQDEMGRQLGLGKSGGFKGFMEALEAKRSPEEFLRRLSPDGNAELLPFLAEHFPQTLNKIKENELMSLAKPAVLRAKGDLPINLKVLSSAVDKATPELRNALFSREALAKIRGAHDLVSSLPEFKSSGTAGRLDQIMSQLPGSVMALVAALIGHGYIAVALLGGAGKLLARDAPDAMRLAMLKFVGSTAPIEPGAFRSTLELIHSAMKGDAAISKAAKGIFTDTEGTKILDRDPTKLIQGPSEAQISKLERLLKGIQVAPQSLMNMAGNLGHYMPEAASSMSQIASSQVAYLNSIRPNSVKQNPLDSDIPPSPAQKYDYERVLAMAAVPLIITNQIKQGNLTQKDVNHFKSLNPALYAKLSSEINSQMMHRLSKGESVPYGVRQSVSTFLGRPLDSTMTPQSIIAAQPKPAAPQPSQQSAPKKSTNSLSKLSKSYQTPGQAAEADQTHR